MDLEKYIQEYNLDSGGIEAIKGFSFQHASIIYFMYILYILEKDFIVSPETLDDFLLIIQTGGVEKTHKVQSKKTKLSINDMSKQDGIFDKLVRIKAMDNFYVTLPINGFKQASKKDDKLSKEFDKDLELDFYQYVYNGTVVKIYEMPFADKSIQMRTYICGLSHHDKIQNSNKVQIAGYFDILFRVITELSELPNTSANAKKIGIEFFKKLENIEKKSSFIDQQIKEISKSINPQFADLLSKRIDVLKYSNEKLSINISIKLTETIKEYYERCEKEIIERKINSTAIDEVAKQIIEWSENGI